MKKTIFVFLTIFFAFTANSTNLCTQRNSAFKAGEELNYEMYYNLSFVWVHAGNVRFTVQNSFVGMTPAYRMQALGTTVRSFDRFFRVRDTLTTFVDSTYITPFLFRQSSQEDTYWKKNEIDFRRNDNGWAADLTSRRRSGIRQETVSSENCFFDILSAVYKFRNIDTSNLHPNQTFPFQVALHDGLYSLSLRYIKTEEVKLRNGDRYRCLVFKPVLVTGEVFRNADGMTIWVTDDENKIPVYIESKIRVGSIRAQVTNIKNARHPLTSKR